MDKAIPIIFLVYFGLLAIYTVFFPLVAMGSIMTRDDLSGGKKFLWFVFVFCTWSLGGFLYGVIGDCGKFLKVSSVGLFLSGFVVLGLGVYKYKENSEKIPNRILIVEKKLEAMKAEAPAEFHQEISTAISQVKESFPKSKWYRLEKKGWEMLTVVTIEEIVRDKKVNGADVKKWEKFNSTKKEINQLFVGQKL